MRAVRAVISVISMAAAVALTSCGGAGGGYSTDPTSSGQPGTGGTGNPTATNQVTLTDANSFSPGAVTVPVGTTVKWTWNSCTSDGYGGYSGCAMHNVTFDDGSNVASPTQSSGTFTRTFSTAGTYKYHCTIHGAGMSGEVVVK